MSNYICPKCNKSRWRTKVKGSVYQCRVCGFMTDHNSYGKILEENPSLVIIAKAEIARKDQFVIIKPKWYVDLWRSIKRIIIKH